MNSHSLKLAVAASAMTMLFVGCGDDVLVSQEVAQSFTTVNSLDPDDCNKKSEGTMAFVKDESTMYVCSDGEWVAMNDQDAIEYRCKTESFSKKDSSGVRIICDGDTIGTVYNGEKGNKGDDGKNGTNGKNGKNGDEADLDAVEEALKDGLKETSKQFNEDLDRKLSSASAKHGEDVENFDKKLSSASAKSKTENDDLDQKLSSLAGEYDKSCQLNGQPKTSEDGKTVTVSVKCGTAEKDFVASLENENLRKVYKKHVVVRLPVQAEKTTRSEDIYEEIWANLKGGNHAELVVVDLDEKLNATGNLFVKDLFADTTKDSAFVTVEGTNKKEVNYKVARLEGDLDITNLSSPVVQLRVTLNLGNFWMNEELVLTSFVDLTDADPEKVESSDTLVIDFLTDYKAARVKNLVKGGKIFAEADAQANTEVANAFALNSDGEYPTLEHYLPNKADFNEYFNSVVWVVALLDQLDIVQNFNGVYNDFRKSLAENGNLRELVKTSFRGEEREMYFGDYLFLLIYTNFYKYRNDYQDPVYYRGSCTDDDPVCNSVNYKIVQKYFKEIYGLDDASGKDLGDGRKIVKSQTTDGYFNYFVYDKAEKIWYPLEASSDNLKLLVQKVLNLDECVASIYGTVEHVNISGIDYTLECFKNMSSSSAWFSNLEESDVSICRKRKDGASVTYFDFGGDVKTGVCKDGALVNANGETAANGKTIDEILNPAEGEGPLGKCTDEIYKDEKKNRKLFDDKDAERSTTTGHAYYICNGKKWVRESWLDEALGICSQKVMELGKVKMLPGSSFYKCDYLDKEETYAWVDADSPEMSRGACHYGIAEQRAVNDDGSAGEVINEGEMSEDGLYECRTTGTDNNGNHVHEWVALTIDEYLGACTETVMADASKNWQKFRGLDYKCDCEKDGDAYKSCGWVESSEKEISLGLACTANILGTVSDPYVCLDADVGHDWQTVTAEEWCPTHGQNFEYEGEKEFKGICDDVPGDNATYLLAGSASSWADVPDSYPWEGNVKTADEKAIEKQLISSNGCAKTDILSLLYDYTIEGSTGHIKDLICMDGKLRVAKDVQEACDNAHETTEICKYMNEWYQYEGNSWKKVLCGEKSYNPEDHFCDARDVDNQTVYRMVTIGEGEKKQTWMAENLNYKTASGSSCYDDDPENCTKYGRLYTWNAAMSACPTGWHLSDTTEWNILGSNVDSHFYGLNSGGNNKAAKYLKAKEGWKEGSGSAGGNGTDDFLFSVQPDPTGTIVYYWTSTRRGTSFYIFIVGFYYVYDAIVLPTTPDNGVERAVRCIKDEP